LGNSQGEVHPPAGRERLGPPRNQANYRISDRDRLGEGSLKQKFRANVEAIKLLRRLETDKRPASEDEKAVLVRYVGWGGLPQVFDVNSREWFKEQVELSKLLTDEEHTSARASTLNAHYTSPVIVRGMYAALARFGFTEGRILEPACGLGHFIGLMPEEMHAHSTITGIEIDQLTARIAKALYPNADIRHQPFEETRLCGLAWLQPNHRAASSSKQTGAIGRNCSRCLISFNRVLVVSRNGAARIERLPKARGPIS
jgi:hypothetical protein